jgi:chromate transporter
LAFVAIYLFHVPFPLIVLSAGLIGYIYSRTQSKEQKATVQGSERFGISILKPLAACLAIWLIPFITILSTLGFKSLPMKIYLFFTQAAFVTFGGAYAVLAYVNQVAVNQYQWITAQQAIDGFGLAETTPGPLIMVLQFIGFMAGWNNAGEMGQTWFAVLCALLTTIATFLPSFFFIFAFAPVVEKFQGNERLSGILQGVTSAVVGVILSLAVAFGSAVIFQEKGANLFALVLGLAALIVLLRFKLDVLWIVLAGGLIGFLKFLLFG